MPSREYFSPEESNLGAYSDVETPRGAATSDHPSTGAPTLGTSDVPSPAPVRQLPKCSPTSLSRVFGGGLFVVMVAAALLGSQVTKPSLWGVGVCMATCAFVLAGVAAMLIAWSRVLMALGVHASHAVRLNLDLLLVEQRLSLFQRRCDALERRVAASSHEQPPPLAAAAAQRGNGSREEVA
jgi:hypothetical protein